MKTITLFLLGLIFSLNSPAQTDGGKLTLSGNIGKYAIEMELMTGTGKDFKFSGRYRYAGKEAYLDLKGEKYDDCIYMEESFKGTPTGYFYVDVWGDSLTGHWVNESKYHPVKLRITKGDARLLEVKSVSEYTPRTSTAKTGSYGNGANYINDYWVSDGEPRYEIGFNGGYMIIEELGGDSLRFQTEVICGPTYHYASAEGIAYRKDTVWVYTSEDGACIITLKFGERSVFAEANSSFDCGFGARAYLMDDFVKMSDDALFGEDVSLGSIKDYEDRK